MSYPTPREYSRTRWTIMLPSGEEYGWYESPEEAEEDAQLLMEEMELRTIEVAKLRLISGGETMNGYLEHLSSEILHNENPETVPA